MTGSGDGDLYLKFGSEPTTSSYDCRPYGSNTNEKCTLRNQEGKDLYIMVKGYRESNFNIKI